MDHLVAGRRQKERMELAVNWKGKGLGRNKWQKSSWLLMYIKGEQCLKDSIKNVLPVIPCPHNNGDWHTVRLYLH